MKKTHSYQETQGIADLPNYLEAPLLIAVMQYQWLSARLQ